MDSSFLPKRPPDPSSTTADKRRHVHHHQQQHQQPPHPPLKPASNETIFRILCPAAKTGGIIDQGGSIIRQFREEISAKISIDDPIPGCNERVIVIVAEASNQCNNSGGQELGNSNGSGEDEGSQAQQALVWVFERILKVDEDRSAGGSSIDGEKGEEKEKEKKEEVVAGGNANAKAVVCRLLVQSNQVGSVLGRGGRIIEKIRQESGAQVRILPKDHIPDCASPGDELIQITGNLSAVKKALFSVSSCLLDNPRADATNAASTKPLGMGVHGIGGPGQGDAFHQQGYASGIHASDFHSRGYSCNPGSDNIGTVLDEEIVFKLLCQLDKVRSLIGKGGSVIRALQNETGASIKIADAAPDSDERVVFISARENSEQNHSPATEAVLRVQSRIAVIGHEPGAAVIARLLVHSQQIGCLLGKGGSIISEMRRATGASIRVFPKEQVPKCGSQNDELVQVIGGLQSVQDALYQITSRLRESIFKLSLNVSCPSFFSPFREMPRPLFRPRHDPSSPSHYSSPVGFHHGIDRPAVAAQPFDYQPAFPHAIDHTGPPNVDRGAYSYSSERPAYGPVFDRPSSPRSWTHQAVNSGNPRGGVDLGSGMALRTGPIRSGSQAPDMTSASVEMVVPQVYLSYVYGENNSNLTQIRQISGATVIIHDPRPGATEGVVVVSGTSDQLRSAQSLVHAFILCGKTAS